MWQGPITDPTPPIRHQGTTRAPITRVPTTPVEVTLVVVIPVVGTTVVPMVEAVPRPMSHPHLSMAMDIAIVTDMANLVNTMQMQLAIISLVRL